jgi:hypothetical protein
MRYSFVSLDHCKSVSIVPNGIPITIGLNALIDCSGDSISRRQSSFNKAIITGCSTGFYHEVSEESEFKLGMILIKALRSTIGKTTGRFFTIVYIVQNL